MRKFMKGALMVMVGLFALVPMINVNAAEGIAEVKTEQEFLDALADESIHTITLTDNIETQKKININRPVTIDGNGKTIEYVGTFKGENMLVLLKVKSMITLSGEVVPMVMVKEYMLSKYIELKLPSKT